MDMEVQSENPGDDRRTELMWLQYVLDQGVDLCSSDGKAAHQEVAVFLV